MVYPYFSTDVPEIKLWGCENCGFIGDMIDACSYPTLCCRCYNIAQSEERRISKKGLYKHEPWKLHNLGKIFEEKYFYRRAAQCFTDAASFGCSESKCSIGELYLNGTGVPKNLNIAYQWFLSAKNHPRGMYLLGCCYAFGYGVNINYTSAIKWYIRAAYSGDPRAQYYIASIYAYGGYDVKKDINRASVWYHAAAIQRYKPALLTLARMYRLGISVNTNPDIVKLLLSSQPSVTRFW